MFMQTPAGSDDSASVLHSEQGKILLSALESAQDLLARRLVDEHHTVTDSDLNHSTVSILLQILFLKTGQKCGLVDPGTLAILAGCDGISNRLARACSDAGLRPDAFFERGPEGTRPLPALPDTPLREILLRMDQLDIPAPGFPLALEEFVTVLEQFLGTRVVAAEGSRVNRAGKSGMLYTGAADVPPRRVVGVVVNEALSGITDGSIIGKEPESRVLDPACGSGVFLLAAYRHLLHKKTRSVDRPKQAQDLLQDLGSVFGVDIDAESVSAARTVLLFAFIEEGRHAGSGTPSPARIREACTVVTKNIRCGNTLVAPDFFLRKPVFPFNAAERRKVNPFDWKEAYPEIMGDGGFTAVIGAPPPYRPFAVPAREDYFQTHYHTYSPTAGIYGYFIERGLSLLKPGGKLVVLVPGTFLRARHARPLRCFLLTFRIDAIVHTGRTRLLGKSDEGMYILSLWNTPPVHNSIVVQEECGPDRMQDFSVTKHMFRLNQDSLDDGGWILEDTRTADIIEKIQRAGTPLGHYVMGEIETGVHPERNNPLVVDRETKNRLTTRSWWCRHFFVPVLRPPDIRRYGPVKPEWYIILTQSRRDLKNCRDLVTYLEKIKISEEQPRGTTGRDNPGAVPLLSISRQDPDENRPKIIFSEFQHSPAFLLDQKGAFALSRSLLAMPRNDPFLAGVLNSTVARFVITQTFPFTDRGYHTSQKILWKFPVYTPDFDNPDDKARHDRLVALVNEMLVLHRHLRRAKTDQEKRIIMKEIESTDRQIDSLVYGLYGLTADEIAVVEETVGR